jgi:hypothetical protein
MWEAFNKQYIQEMSKSKDQNITIELPGWLNKYMEYKFNLLDRTGKWTTVFCVHAHVFARKNPRASVRMPG